MSNARVHGKGKQPLSESALEVLELGDSDDQDEPPRRDEPPRHLRERKLSVVSTGGAGTSASSERQTDGRGRLVRRYVGGVLAEDPSAAPLLRRPKQAPPPEDTTDSLIVQLKKNRTGQDSFREQLREQQEIIGARQEKLRTEEVEILVKLSSRHRQT